MKRKLLLLGFIVISLITYGQKADVSSVELRVNIERPEYLTNIKTFSYELQDDDKTWKGWPISLEHPTLTSLTDGIKIKGLEAVDEDPDIRVTAGFILKGQSLNPQMLNISGILLIRIIARDNTLLESLNMDIEASKGLAGEGEELYNNSAVYFKTIAEIITNRVERYFEKNDYIFNDEYKQTLPFAQFKKIKKNSPAVQFNEKAKELTDAVIADVDDIAAIDKAEAYFKEQLTFDFGKKIKSKVKNQVLYANLASLAILKRDKVSLAKYYEILKDNTGFFTLWTADISNYINALADLKEKTYAKRYKVISDNIYKIVLDTGGYYAFSNKLITYNRVEISRFSYSIDVYNIKNFAPKVKIYFGDENKYEVHKGTERDIITTNDGNEILFKNIKSYMVPFVKEADGAYRKLK